MKRKGLFVAAIFVLVLTSLAAGQVESVLHNFSVFLRGHNPQAKLVSDAAGNLYGVTPNGGRYGCGVVFKLSPSGRKWTQTILYNFSGGNDGCFLGSVIFDKAGNLYGDAGGGAPNITCSTGCGLIFRLSPNSNGSWTKSVIYYFPGGADSSYPKGPLLFDNAGSLYGVAAGGLYGEGTVFKLSANSQGSWTETVLYNFTGQADGGTPDGGLVFDSIGNLYGTTTYGGDPNCNLYGGGDTTCGVVYELSRNRDGSWSEITLQAFDNTNGAYPTGQLFIDSAGSLYGTTTSGPGTNCGVGCGTFFRLSPNSDGSWAFNLLYTFAGGPDAWFPNGGMGVDSLGNFYGTSRAGGASGCGHVGCGTVFEIFPSSGKIWQEKVLHRFSTAGSEGNVPLAGVVLDPAGNVYGTAYSESSSCPSYYSCAGTVFKVSPGAGGKWTASAIYRFSAGNDGIEPVTALASDGAGNLYGFTQWGGDYSCGYQGCGAIFEISPLAGGGWTEHVLRRYSNIPNSGEFLSSFVVDSAGNLFGSSKFGGKTSSDSAVSDGCGNVFELSPTGNGTWQETVLYYFHCGSDGSVPSAALTFDANGNLYGTTKSGGSSQFCCGTVFMLTRGSNGQWSKKTIFAFPSSTGGNGPQSAVVFDPSGNLYGTLSSNYQFDGAVFELSPNGLGGWTEATIYAFLGGADGGSPNGVVVDSAGNLYGTTIRGGKDLNSTVCPAGCGTVFELTASGGRWNKTILYSFQPVEVAGDGATPSAGVLIGADDNLYGTTNYGGAPTCVAPGCGTVYKLSRTGGWSETVLYDFDGLHGSNPGVALILNSAGKLFGATQNGGTDGLGVVFEIDPTLFQPASQISASGPIQSSPSTPRQMMQGRSQIVRNPRLPNTPQGKEAQ